MLELPSYFIKFDEKQQNLIYKINIIRQIDN